MTSHSAVESAAEAPAGERKVAIEPLKGKLDLSDCRGDFGLLTGHAAGNRQPRSRRSRGRTGRTEGGTEWSEEGGCPKVEGPEGAGAPAVNPQGKAEGEQGTGTNAREESESQEDPRSLAMCRTRKPKPT